MTYSPDFKQRLLASIETIPFHECYEWTGQTRNGYGRFKIKGKYYTATRVVWELANGPISEGLVVRHKCDNPGCVRLEHLELGTQAENIQDTLARGHHFQASQTHCKYGHEYSDETTYVDPSGYRQCRICRRVVEAKYRARKRERKCLSTS